MKPSSRKKRAIVKGRRRGWDEGALWERYGPQDGLVEYIGTLLERAQLTWLIRHVVPATEGH